MKKINPKLKGISRREFLKDTGKLLMGGSLFWGVGAVIPKITGAVAKKAYNWEEHSYAYTIEIARCLGCGMCARACKTENNVPQGLYRTWVERYSFLKTGEVVVDSPKGAVEGFRPLSRSFAI